jgi:peptide/nickel transport system substrate-binding protein/glutathione transport system substrate-binding protein
MIAAPSSLDPHRFTGYAADTLFGMVYGHLVHLRPDWNGVEPDLAHRWEVSPNEKAYTFYLRPNVKFHDGSTLTADDVLFSFERIMDPKTGAYARAFMVDVLERVTAINATTVRFVLRKPYAGLLAVLALPTASIVSRKWMMGGANPNLTMMGTGPMKFRSLEPNVRIVLVRNEQYFEPGVPYLDGFNLQFLPDDTARSTALRSGSVDLIDYTPWRDLAAIKADPNLRVYSDSEAAGVWAFPNLRRPPMDNRLLRQAINWAMNRDTIAKAVFFGTGAQMASVFMPKSMWAYTPEIPKYEYDPDRAKDLIRQSGVRMPVRLDLLGASATRHMRGNMEVLQANLQEVGFDAQLRLIEFPDLMNRLYASDFQIVAQGGGPAVADPDFLYSYFHSSGQFAKWCGYSNAQMDYLLDSARTTSNRLRRKSLYVQAYKLIFEDAPWFPMNYREQAESASTRVQGYNRVLGSNWNGIRIAKIWLSA